MLTVTVALVYGWAAPVIGLRPAGWLAVIGWTAWLARHQPAQLDRSAGMRRLTAKVQRHAQALAKTTAPAAPRPACPPPAARPDRPGSTQDRGSTTAPTGTPSRSPGRDSR
jgi:hypothetical protein